MSMVEIEFADHRKFRLGDRVEFYVPDGERPPTYKGVIVDITDDGMIMLDPGIYDDWSGMPAIERSNGRYRVRWFGLAGGFILRKIR